jgi:hypothetical protein
VTGDLPRRSFSIRLDANAERPWERTGFRIRDLEQYIDANRGNLLAAALTIIRAWYTHGKPMVPIPALGSFQEWADTIGSVLAFAGISGFLTNLEQTQVVQDESAQEWTAFFDAWWERFGGRQLTADDVCRVVMPQSRDPVEYIDDPLVLALPEPLSANRDRGDGAFIRSQGTKLYGNAMPRSTPKGCVEVMVVKQPPSSIDRIKSQWTRVPLSLGRSGSTTTNSPRSSTR